MCNLHRRNTASTGKKSVQKMPVPVSGNEVANADIT